MATAAASGYHVAQLARTLYLGRFAGDGGCRRAMACVSFFLDKVPSHPWQRFCPLLHSIFPDTEAERPVLAPNRFRLNASLSCLVR
jgi:hypothetical protein